MKIYLSPLLIPLAAAAVWTHTAPRLALAYASVTLHELAHLIAALCIGLRADNITLSPFGAHLTLKNKIIRSLADEVILYAAGPLMNGVIAAAAAYFGCRELYRINTALMVINLLPVPPLDGGIILKRVIAYNAGMRVSERVCTVLSVSAGAIFLTAAVYGVCIGQINPSMFIMAVFMFGTAATGKELYSADLISGISAEKRSNRARLVIIRNDDDILEVVKQISPAYTTIAAVKDKTGELRLLDEQMLLENAHKNSFEM